MGFVTQFIYLLAVAFTCQTTSSASTENHLALSQPNSQPKSPSSTHDEKTQLSTASLGEYENYFLEKLLDEYGTDGMVSIRQLKQLVMNIKVNFDASGKENGHPSEIEGATDAISEPGMSDVGGEATKLICNDANGCTSNKCLSMAEIFVHHSLTPVDMVNGSTLEHMSPTILYQLQNPQCKMHGEGKAQQHKPKPDAAAVWGFGFLCVTLINLCALMGMVFLPLMRRSFYKNMLLFMVALAVGTLTGSGLLFLIPESFEMTSPDSPHADIYIWRCLTVICGIYLFFLVERLLKMIMKYKQNSKEKEEMEDMPIASVPTHSVHLEDSMNMSFKPVPSNVASSGNRNSDCLIPKNSSPAHQGDHANSMAEGDVGTQIQNGQSNQSSPQHQGHGHSHGTDLRNVRSVAWMVIFGDGLHNFIDGLSIGAAFSGSTMTGFSVSLAVFCEELPHELGDFAILLNSGMSMRQALSYNFLSACMCYLGLIVGIIVGETTTGAVYIFAVAGGMFLYIALVDMLPEVNHAADEEEAATGSRWSIFLLQNAGLLMGIVIMLLLAVFSGKIDLTHLEE